MAILRQWLTSRPWHSIGHWPTPLEQLTTQLWVKRDDLSHPVYGGNKVRTLEPILGQSASQGITDIIAIGAYGSNHTLATATFAGDAGINCHSWLFPQSYCRDASLNYASLRASDSTIRQFPSIAALAAAAVLTRRKRGLYVMPPGGATAIGALGGVSAALELLQQLDDLALRPDRIVIAIGSSCTTAGLVAGLWLARHWQLWKHPVPHLEAVRITPWPVTNMRTTAKLARSALAEIAKSEARPVTVPAVSQLKHYFTIVGDQLGAGYGRRTADARKTRQTWQEKDWPQLDDVYSAKAAAHIQAHPFDKLTVFWHTKSRAQPKGLSESWPV